MMNINDFAFICKITLLNTIFGLPILFVSIFNVYILFIHNNSYIQINHIKNSNKNKNNNKSLIQTV